MVWRLPEIRARPRVGDIGEECKVRTTKRMIFAVGVCVMISAVGACSGAKSRKAPGPAALEKLGDPCSTECCCRVVDGYYHRFACTTKVECSSGSGECREPDASQCRR